MTPLVKRGLDWTPNPDHVRAVSYIRQSRKREDDSASSPEAQRTKCEALITAKGWDNAGHFADVGKSGWDPKVVRPEFEEMMSAVRAGHVDAVGESVTVIAKALKVSRATLYRALADTE
ncbi:recombinase family protein [Streptomyces gibsoniae]|uniref:Recombinase family protein n=1 Tax=Streptomyces gibsoniae TaxID=3075529 RepID=A0ABU2TZ96_9ACTN|nr:recombinase family protein [Streptomyces sp. DSM 41699]MDT0466156.1 recombinase family protein [Streptomyces sp. DSM 41699]